MSRVTCSCVLAAVGNVDRHGQYNTVFAMVVTIYVKQWIPGTFSKQGVVWGQGKRCTNNAWPDIEI